MDLSNTPGGEDPAAEDPHSVAAILARVSAAAEGDRVTVRKLLSAFGRASFGPVLLLPALAVVTPLSGIPVFSSLCGITIALVSGQMVAGRRFLWLPGFVLERRLRTRMVHDAVRRLERPSRYLDRISRPRFRALVRRPLALLPQTLCLLCGLAMPLLELVPLTSSLLGAAVSLMAVGFVLRDGLFTIGGMAFILAAVGLLAKIVL